MQLGLTARPGTGMHDFHIHDTANKPYSGSRQREQAMLAPPSAWGMPSANKSHSESRQMQAGEIRQRSLSTQLCPSFSSALSTQRVQKRGG